MKTNSKIKTRKACPPQKKRKQTENNKIIILMSAIGTIKQYEQEKR
jgi:hypothetical protein